MSRGSVPLGTLHYATTVEYPSAPGLPEPRALRSTVTASANTAASYATYSACYGARARLAEVFAAPFEQTKSAAPMGLAIDATQLQPVALGARQLAATILCHRAHV